MVIVGSKGFAKEVLEVLWQNGDHENIAFFDNLNHQPGDIIYGRFPVLVNLEEVTDYFIRTGNSSFSLGLGNPIIRYKMFRMFEEIGGRFSSTISPYARIGSFETVIEEGCNIMTGTVITNSIRIGRGSLINLNCTVGHDSIVDEFVEMSPGTHISGNCRIGRFTVLGTNSTVLPKISICENVIIGAGAVVTKDIHEPGIYVGTPAKKLEKKHPDEGETPK